MINLEQKTTLGNYVHNVCKIKINRKLSVSSKKDDLMHCLLSARLMDRAQRHSLTEEDR